MSTVLVVDDSAVDRKLVGGLLSKAAGVRVAFAASGEEALGCLDEVRPEVVVTDLVMPGMSGLDLVAQVVERYPQIPVILMTGKGSEQTAVKALKAGAASYVPKGVLHQHLLTTVQDVLDMVRDRYTQQRLMNCLKHGRFQFALANEANLIPSLITHVQSLLASVGLCDESNVIRVCIALEEALRNAMFHGNLELSSEQREGDVTEYQRLIDERIAAEPYASRRLHVTVDVTPTRGRFTIRDEGPGFDPNKLPDPTDPENLEKVSGRGLLLMRTFMDHVDFNATGNEVTMIKRCAGAAAHEPPGEAGPGHISAARERNVLVITPLVTFATFDEPEMAREWTLVQEQLDDPETKHVVIDLGRIPYFGSTVLEWMTLLWKRIKAKGGRLALCSPSAIGREVLAAARFERLWPIHASREEAIQWLRSGNGAG
jgi:anti-anti-sigma factor